jgi:voltage-gated potassium channel
MKHRSPITFFSGILKQNINLLFISLLLFIMLYPLCLSSGIGMQSLMVFLVIILVAGLRALGPHEKARYLGRLILLFSVLTTGTLYFLHSPYKEVVGMFCSLLFFVFTAVRLQSFVMNMEKLTQERLVSALCVYILMGIIWAQVYFIVDFFHHGAFTVPSNQALILMPEHQRFHTLLYYSFITLTTVGYGDITPVLPLARSLSICEVITGQFYIVVLIGHIVSSQMVRDKAALDEQIQETQDS